MDSSSERGRAREARANDRAVLEAARDVFAAQGFDAPTSVIAQRAGVGVGSIYRRYRSKDELVHALRLLALDDVTAIAVEVAAERPDFAVARFLSRHLAEAASPLATTFGLLLPSSVEIDAAADRLRDALDALIALDAPRGLLPEGFSSGEIMIVLSHLRPHLPIARERAVELALRQLDLYLAGLREVAEGRAAQRGEPLSWDEWAAFNSAP